MLERTASSISSKSPSRQENGTFTLANGHTLGFSSCGPVDAPALFYFHGQGGCRLQGLSFAEDADRVGLRIICPDRPGIGLSTFDPDRKLLDYPAQIASLAQHLGLETYRVMGGSGGGPYVLGECLPILRSIHFIHVPSGTSQKLGARHGTRPLGPSILLIITTLIRCMSTQDLRTPIDES